MSQNNLFRWNQYGRAYPADDSRPQDVAETSREIYKTEQKRMGTQTARVLTIYQKGGRPLTDQEVRQQYRRVHGQNIPASTVSARRNELVRFGLVDQGDKRKCTVTNRTVKAYEVVA